MARICKQLLQALSRKNTLVTYVKKGQSIAQSTPINRQDKKRETRLLSQVAYFPYQGHFTTIIFFVAVKSPA